MLSTTKINKTSKFLQSLPGRLTILKQSIENRAPVKLEHIGFINYFVI